MYIHSGAEKVVFVKKKVPSAKFDNAQRETKYFDENCFFNISSKYDSMIADY